MNVLSLYAMLLAVATWSFASDCATDGIDTICCVPTEVLYLLDHSLSVTQGPQFDSVIDFIKESRCLFSNTNTKAGLIVFNGKVEVKIPLTQTTSSQWNALVNATAESLGAPTKYTPMAEALWKAQQVFGEAESQCGANRLVILISDGRPYQNMPDDNPYAGSDIPNTWLYSSTMNSAKYAEEIVPEQASILKTQFKARLVVIALTSGGSTLPNNARIDYFKGIVTPEFRCERATPYDTADSCGSLTKAITQCYKSRVTTHSGNPDIYGSNPNNKYSQCANRNSTLFPIATDVNHVIPVEQSLGVIQQALQGNGPLAWACPYHV